MLRALARTIQVTENCNYCIYSIHAIIIFEILVILTVVIIGLYLYFTVDQHNCITFAAALCIDEYQIQIMFYFDMK